MLNENTIRDLLVNRFDIYNLSNTYIKLGVNDADLTDNNNFMFDALINTPNFSIAQDIVVDSPDITSCFSKDKFTLPFETFSVSLNTQLLNIVVVFSRNEKAFVHGAKPNLEGLSDFISVRVFTKYVTHSISSSVLSKRLDKKWFSTVPYYIGLNVTEDISLTSTFKIGDNFRLSTTPEAFEKSFDDNRDIVLRSAYDFTLSNYHSLIMEENKANIDGMCEKCWFWTLNMAISFLIVLNTAKKHTLRVPQEAERKLSIAQGVKKNNTFWEYHVVEVTTAVTNTSEVQEASHAERCSPRQHDRRGSWHVRKKSGKRYFVRSCVVGKIEDGRIEKDYTFKG